MELARTPDFYFEFTDMYDQDWYSLANDLEFVFREQTIVVPGNLFLHNVPDHAEFVYAFMRSDKTTDKFYDCWIYLDAMKSNKVGIIQRWRRFLLSLFR